MGMVMKWFSTIEDGAVFQKKVTLSPDSTFVSGYLNGRLMHITVSTATELDESMSVFGPQEKWLVHVNRIGFRLKAILLRPLSKKAHCKRP